jgi:hypothetical protein
MKKVNIEIHIRRQVLALIMVIALLSLAYLAYGFKGAFWASLPIGLLVLSALSQIE